VVKQDDIAEGIAKESFKTSKLRALKVQFNFRKQVLGQINYRLKELFLFSKTVYSRRIDR